MEQRKGHCKHGEFNLMEGCPKCIQERQEHCGSPGIEPKIVTAEKPEVAIKPQEFPTAVVRIAPGKDATVQALLDEVLKLQRYAQEREIRTNDDVKAATNDLTIIQQLKKRIMEKQKEYLDPINRHVEAVRDAFKLLLDPIGVADKLTRDKILSYRETLRQLEEAERLLEESKAKLEHREPAQVPVVEQPGKYRAELGTTGTVKVWKWEVVNFAKVPDEYKIIDAQRVRKVIQAGGSIPGIRAWQEETLRVTGSKMEK